MRGLSWKLSELAITYTSVRFYHKYDRSVASTNQINQNTAKASLTQMINIVFKNMDVYSGNVSIPLAKL